MTEPTHDQLNPGTTGLIQREATIFERSSPNRVGFQLPPLEVPRVNVSKVLPEYFNITPCPTSPGSPWQNAFAESFFATLRRELLNHLIFRDETKLRKCLKEYIDFYNNQRMHSGIMEAPFGNTITKRPHSAKLKSRPILNGLHHIYYWEDYKKPGSPLSQQAA